MKTTRDSALKALRFVLPVGEGIGEWAEPAIHTAPMDAIAAAGLKNGPVLWPMRIAISGQASTPGGAVEIAWLLGREETLRRLRAGIRLLEGNANV